MIKTTSKGDIPALKEVLDETGLFPGNMLPDMLAPALAACSPDLWLTCHAEGEAIGFCYTVPEALTDGTWNLLALAVHPEHQGRGHGAALVRAAEQRLKAQGQRLLIVETSGTDSFAGARMFYAANGYEEAARIRDFWAECDDKLVFRKVL